MPLADLGGIFANDPRNFGFDTFTIDREDGHMRSFVSGSPCDGAVRCNGGDGFRTPETSYLIPPSERLLFDFSGRFDVNDELSLFANAKYGKSESYAVGQASIFHDSNYGKLISLKLDNPFLPSELQTLMQQRNLSEVALAVVGLPASTDNERQTMQFTFGGEGPYDEYDYNFYVQHGRVTSDLRQLTTYNERYFRALDATTDENGNAVCRDTSDPACVPYNPIFKQASQEAIDYAGVVRHQEQTKQQTLASFAVNGSLFETDLGTVSFAAGIEYRKEKSEDLTDPLTHGRAPNGAGLGLVGVTRGLTPETHSFTTPIIGDYSSSEVFGEINMPVLEDLPLVESLDWDAAVRYADNNITGGDTTYKSGFNWQVGYDIGSRVSFSKAVRAPNVRELFAATSSTAVDLDDPCHYDNLNRNPAVVDNRKANCAKLGIAPDFQSNASFGSLLAHTKGNFKPETAETLTVGLTYTPSADFNIAVDFWDIEIEDAITMINGTDVLENCVDGSDLHEQFCSKINRQSSGLINYVEVNGINAARFKARGVDLESNVGVDFEYGRLDFRVNVSYLDERITEQNPEAGLPAINIAGTQGYPRLRANISTTYRLDKLVASIN